MNHTGLLLACRYSYPPNSLSLCGPAKQKDLQWYTSNQVADAGTAEILQQFSTLYPYLCFIAAENHLSDPFDPRIIEAYWIGNTFLQQTLYSDLIHFLDQDLAISKKLIKKEIAVINQKVVAGALPHHSFHVLNLYRRTGHLDIPQTVTTMDACIINWGEITAINDDSIMVETKPLRQINQTLQFGKIMQRKLRLQGEKDSLKEQLTIGDWVSYHWGFVCSKIDSLQLKNLIFYTQMSLKFANLRSGRDLIIQL